MPLGRRKKPQLSREQALAARPVRLPADPKLEPLPSGGARLTVKLRPSRWGRLLLRLPESGLPRTFELDAVGLHVWQACDGATTVERLIRSIADEFRLNLREAEVSTLQFLQTLTGKGLIGLEVPRESRPRKK